MVGLNNMGGNPNVSPFASSRATNQRVSNPSETKLLIPSQPHLPKSVQTKVMLSNKKSAPQVFQRLPPNHRVPMQSPQPTQSSKMTAQQPMAPKADVQATLSPANRQNDVQLQRKRFLQMMRSGNVGDGQFEIRFPENSRVTAPAPPQSTTSENQAPSTESTHPKEAVPEKIMGEIHLVDSQHIDSDWESQYRLLIIALGGNVCDNDDETGEGLTQAFSIKFVIARGDLARLECLAQEEVEAFVRKHGNTPKSATPRPESIQFTSPFTSPTKAARLSLHEVESGSDSDDGDSDDSDD